jgi:hypothetical protein
VPVVELDTTYTIAGVTQNAHHLHAGPNLATALLDKLGQAIDDSRATTCWRTRHSIAEDVLVDRPHLAEGDLTAKQADGELHEAFKEQLDATIGCLAAEPLTEWPSLRLWRCWSQRACEPDHGSVRGN